MEDRRFHAIVKTVKEGGENIKRLIADVENAQKDMKYGCYFDTHVKISFNGSFRVRRIELEDIENMEVVNDQLKISFSAWVCRNNVPCLDSRGATFTIPIKMIETIEVKVII